eukprot:4476751-Amphidinium_carterae.1
MPLMVCDRAAEWGWLISPYTQDGLRQDAVVTLWLQHEHFWLAANPINVEAWPLAEAAFPGSGANLRAGGMWGYRLAAAAAAVTAAAQSYRNRFGAGEGDWQDAALAIDWRPQGKNWTVGSINGNVWNTALRQVAGWKHRGDCLDVVFVQEHRLAEDRIPGAQREVSRLGYQAFLSDSKPAKGTQHAAGVGILVGSHIGAKP